MAAHALDRHIALVGFMGAGKSTLGDVLAERLGRPFIDIDREIERDVSIPELFATEGEAGFRVREAKHVLAALERRGPAVIALGGGAVETEQVRGAVRRHALAVLVEVDVDTAWQRSRGSGRPLARDETQFRNLYERRASLFLEVADAVASDPEAAVLAAGGVHVESGSLELLGELVPGDGPLDVVADARVAGIYGMEAQLALGRRIRATHELPPGEEAKTVAAVERLWDDLRLDRGGALVALGGGCTTDAAGFVAATYLRGIDWVAVPTTLVGQVDAAIGGKTGVNLEHGKNLVGTIHQPSVVLCDVGLLQSLPEAELRAGLAEVIKYGFVARPEMLDLVMGNVTAILDRDERVLSAVVARSAAIKSAVVAQDERDAGVRAHLNYGHTFAHAIEATHPQGIRHGEAVALGMMAAAHLACALGRVDERVVDLHRRVLDAVGLPTTAELELKTLEKAWRHDKKYKGGMRFVLLEGLGEPEAGVRASKAVIATALERMRA